MLPALLMPNLNEDEIVTFSYSLTPHLRLNYKSRQCRQINPRHTGQRQAHSFVGDTLSKSKISALSSFHLRIHPCARRSPSLSLSSSKSYIMPPSETQFKSMLLFSIKPLCTLQLLRANIKYSFLRGRAGALPWKDLIQHLAGLIRTWFPSIM